MRIFLLITEDPVYTPELITTLLHHHPGKIIGAAFPNRFFSARRVIYSFLVFGPLHFMRLAILYFFNMTGGGAAHRLLRRNSVPILDVGSVNDPNFIDNIRDQKIDVIVSWLVPQLLHREVLSVPNQGAINLHLGMLPAYRGLFPTFHAIIRSEKKFGVSVHYMDEQFDNGAIINQSEIAIAPRDGIFDLYPKAFKAGAQQLCAALSDIEMGKVQTRSNGPEGSSYHSFPTLREIGTYWLRVAKWRRKSTNVV